MDCRCVLEVDLDIVRENYLSARRVSGTKVIPVVKADAYGLGAIEVSRALAREGVELFAVAEAGEAYEVMNACGVPALIMGLVPDCGIAEAVERGAVLTVADLRQAKIMSAAAVSAGKPARVHIKLDTGLHRIGFDAGDVDSAAEIFSLSGIKVEGLYTHLALRNEESDMLQISRLVKFSDALKSRGLDCGMLHALDSIGMMKYPDCAFDAVRAGAWLYGNFHKSFKDPALCPPAARLSARIMQVRRVEKGECVGYDDEHPLLRDSVIATVSAGYCDGLPRANNAGFAVVRGFRAPIAGLVCMDSLMLDVTDIPNVSAGDEAVFLGEGITALEAAGWYGVNRNELIARTGRRVKRVYRGLRQ